MKSQVHPWVICICRLIVSLPLLLGHSFLFIPSSTSTMPQHGDHSALLLLSITSSGAEAGCSAKWQRLSSQAGGRAPPDCLLLLFHSPDFSQHWSFLGNLRQLQPKRDCWQWGIFKPGPNPSIQAHHATVEPAAQPSTCAFRTGALCSRNASSLSRAGKEMLHTTASLRSRAAATLNIPSKRFTKSHVVVAAMRGCAHHPGLGICCSWAPQFASGRLASCCQFLLRSRLGACEKCLCNRVFLLLPPAVL